MLTCEGDAAFKNNNCVNAFFAFRDQLRSREEHYISNYGLLPEFKAGMNYGIVTATEVGDIKREIAFHGDAINTAARIQGKCNELNRDFLTSRSITDRLPGTEAMRITKVGDLSLKGKKSVVEIHSIERIPVGE